MAARAGLAQNCQFLLEHTKGHLGNEVDAQGQSALHHAVSCDGVECVAYLLSSALSANQPDFEMRTYVIKHQTKCSHIIICVHVYAQYVLLWKQNIQSTLEHTSSFCFLSACFLSLLFIDCCWFLNLSMPDSSSSMRRSLLPSDPTSRWASCHMTHHVTPTTN